MKLKQNGFFDIHLILTIVILIAIGGFVIFRIQSASVDVVPEVQTNEGTEIVRTPFVFAAAGDFDNGLEADSVLTGIGQIESDFTLALGDLGYVGNGNEPEWCEFVKARVGDNYPFQLVAGNHDDGNNDGDIREYAKCLPNRIDNLQGDYGIEYYFDYGNLARIIMISPDIENYGFDYVEGSENFEWIRSTVEDARRQRIPWTVLGMHKNCITPGVKTCEIGPDILNLALELKIDLVLQGHEHAYFRSKQLALSDECPAIIINETNQSCISGEGDEFTKNQGTIIVISGAGGRNLRDVNLDDPEIGYFDAWSGENVERSFGYNTFNVSENQISAKFFSTIGSFSDSFSIIQQ